MSSNQSPRPAPLAPATLPNTMPVWVTGWNMPGYLPDPDSVYALHLRPYSKDFFEDDVTRVCDILTERMIEDLEESAEQCRIDRDTYPDDYDTDTDPDPGSGDTAMAESLFRYPGGRTGEAYEDIRHGIARAVRSGTGYTYTLNLGNGETVAYWVMPSSDPVPVCTEYATDGQCESGACGPDATLTVEPLTVDDGSLYVQSTPDGAVGYRVIIERDESAYRDNPREWSNTWLWSMPNNGRVTGFDETPGDMFGRHGSALDVWNELRDRLPSDGAAYEAFRLLCRLRGYTCAPLARAYDGTVSTDDPGTPDGHTGTRGRLFEDVYGSVDGVAVVDPNDADTDGEYIEPVHGILHSECTVYSQWSEGEVYLFTLERVTPDTDGAWPARGEHLESCGGFYGWHHDESGLVHEAVDAIAEHSAVFECTYCARYGSWFRSSDRDAVVAHADSHPVGSPADMAQLVRSDSILPTSHL